MRVSATSHTHTISHQSTIVSKRRMELDKMDSERRAVEHLKSIIQGNSLMSPSDSE